MEKMTQSDCAGFCEAIECAYIAPDVTQEIRSHTVGLLVDCDMMSHAASFQGCALQKTMKEYPDVAIDVALTLKEKHHPRGSKRTTETLEWRHCYFCGVRYESGLVHYCL